MSRLAFLRSAAIRKSLIPVAVAQLSLPGRSRTCANSSASDPTFMADGRDDRHHGVGDPRDRHEIGGVVGQLVVQERMRGEDRGRREQQRVIVMGADEGADPDDAVAAGTILDHHRLAPARRQPVGQQPRRDVGTAAGAQRHDEPDVALRPRLGRGRRCRGKQRKPGTDRRDRETRDHETQIAAIIKLPAVLAPRPIPRKLPQGRVGHMSLHVTAVHDGPSATSPIP